MSRRVFNSFDPNLGYPQPALFGRGGVSREGIHTPHPGFFGHEVTDDLVHGPDDEFYETTAPSTLTPKSQADVDAIIAARQAAIDAEEATKNAKRDKVENDKGQGGGLPLAHERIDDVIDRLRDLGIEV